MKQRNQLLAQHWWPNVGIQYCYNASPSLVYDDTALEQPLIQACKYVGPIKIQPFFNCWKPLVQERTYVGPINSTTVAQLRKPLDQSWNYVGTMPFQTGYIIGTAGPQIIDSQWKGNKTNFVLQFN